MNESTDTHKAVKRTYLGRERREILPGDTLCLQDIPGGEKQMAQMIANETIVPRSVVVTPGMFNKPAPIPHTIGGNDSDPELTGIVGRVKRPKEGSLKPVTKYQLDPEGLAGTSLEDLNIMVAERDPELTPYETVEEAIAHLSQDFHPETQG